MSDDGRLLTLGALGVLLAGAAAVRGSRGVVREGRSGPCDASRAVEVLANQTIVTMNDLQRAKWSQDGILVCPHGSDKWVVVELNIVFWGRHRTTGHKAIEVPSGSEFADSAGPQWCECHCREGQAEPRAFWPPADWKVEYV